ncbi:small subunit ribosomal protein S12e [Nematocida displodere]|uniref:Small subunit ribosomal protein S12e n=1 Tax=Nematocida displodere TaxID=1805483 RepID=A0A177EET0_9MICR|nr:small subunit ribosomal protein S12e [Nematocida displodere]
MEHVAQQGEKTMTDMEAFSEMCLASIKAGGLIKGFRQVTKSIISRRAKLIILSTAINQKDMTAVIEGLTTQYGVPVAKVGTHEDIAELVRICKKDETGKTIKKAKCAVASIEDFGESSEGKKQIFAQIGL